MASCPHQRFESSVEVSRLSAQEGGPIDRYAADIRISCADCAEQFIFPGVPGGLSPYQPMVSADRTELRAPIRPSSSFRAI